MSSDFDRSFRFLKSKNISVQRDWVEACLEWLISENQGNPILPAKLNDLIYEQWLMSDLQDISEPCLKPDQFEGKGPGTLQGVHMLQINYIINISESAFSQYQKLKGLEIDDTVEGPEQKNSNKENKWKFKSSRMMFMQLTDGFTKIDAIEYHPINLDAKVDPGCKVRLTGPIPYFDGLLLLQRENISILGGNAEELSNQFSLATLLKTSLGITVEAAPIKTEPKKEEIVTSAQRAVEDPVAVPMPDEEDIFDDLPNIDMLDQEPNFFHDQPPTSVNRGNPESRGQVSTTSFIDNKRNISNKQPQKTESTHSHQPLQQKNRKSKVGVACPFNLPEFEDDFDDFDEDFDILPSDGNIRSNALPPVKTNSNSSERFHQSKDPHAQSSTHVTDSPLFSANEVGYEEWEEIPDDVKTDKEKDKVITISEGREQTRFKTKARVTALLTSLRTFPSYHLKVAISDGSTKMEATVDPSVITKLIGYSADELESFKTKHPRVRESVKQAVLNSQRKLAAGLWELTIVRIEGEQRSSYRITEMTEVT